MLDVVGARRLDDATTVGEEVRDDAREFDARIFRLDVEQPSAVANVVVETEDGRSGQGKIPAKYANLRIALPHSLVQPPHAF
jgi:hypothetical protein